MTPVITTEQLKKVIDSQGKYTLIDVREKEELQHGMIPTAKNIPFTEFEEAWELDNTSFQKKYGFPKPKKEDNLIFHCRTGGRSAQATAFAISEGYHATNYQGSIWEWSLIDKNVKRYGSGS